VTEPSKRPVASGVGSDGQPLTQAEFEALPTEADQIAAMARSLRGKLLSGPIGEPITATEAADVVELIELLADSIAGISKP